MAVKVAVRVVVVHKVIDAGNHGPDGTAVYIGSEAHQDFTAAVAAIGAQVIGGAEVDGEGFGVEIVAAASATAEAGAEVGIGVT